MKLLYAYRYGIIGGVSTQLMFRRKALNDAGICCELFFSQDNGLKQVLSDRDGIHFGTDVIFSQIVNKGKYDAVVVIDSPELLSPARGPIYRRSLVYLDVHTTTNTGLAYLADIVPNRLAGVMVPTHYSSNLISRLLPVNSYVSILPNIIDANIFSEKNDSLNACVKEGDLREFIWVGKLDHHKNWRLALVYASMLREMFGDIIFHVVGGYTAPPSQAEAFFQLAYRLGVSSNVSWLDRAENISLSSLYSKCANSGGAMLVTSRDESFGMAAAEALLCGCPLIANDLPVFREVFPDSTLVHRVDIWKPDQVAAAAEALPYKPNLDDVRDMRAHLIKHYSAESFVKAFKSAMKIDR